MTPIISVIICLMMLIFGEKFKISIPRQVMIVMIVFQNSDFEKKKIPYQILYNLLQKTAGKVSKWNTSQNSEI